MDDTHREEMGEPTAWDRQKASIWVTAREQDADIYRLLSDEQKALIDARIEWAIGQNASTKANNE